MTYVSHIVERFGGVRRMASAMNRAPSTVQSWKVRGSIPDADKPSVLTTARALGIALGPEDFFPAEASASGQDAA